MHFHCLQGVEFRNPLSTVNMIPQIDSLKEESKKEVEPKYKKKQDGYKK